MSTLATNPFAGLVTPTPPAPPVPPAIPVFTWDPSFEDDGVTINDTQPVPPQYCASMAGALALQAYLLTQGIPTTITMAYPLYPQYGAYNWYNQSSKVPYLNGLGQYAGAVENAGGLIYNFRPGGLPYPLADYTCKRAFLLDSTAFQQMMGGA